MTKKVAVIVGGGSGFAAAIARVMAQDPERIVTFVDTGEKTDGPLMTVDEAGQNIFYDPKIIDSITAGMSERELYGITIPDALALVNDRKLGDYKIPQKVEDIKLELEDDLPNNTTKPKFLMARDHHIRSPRGRR